MSNLFDLHADEKQAINPRWAMKFGFYLADDEHAALVYQQSALFYTQLPQPFGASTFEELQIICIINDATCVGIFPVDPDRKRKNCWLAD